MTPDGLPGDPTTVAVSSLRAGQDVVGVFACIRKDRLTTRTGAAYLALELRGVKASGVTVADFHTLTANYRSSRAILETVNAISRADFSERPERAFEIRYTAAEELVLPSTHETAPHGVVTMHISNRHLELQGVVVGIAKDIIGTRAADRGRDLRARLHPCQRSRRGTRAGA